MPSARPTTWKLNQIIMAKKYKVVGVKVVTGEGEEKVERMDNFVDEQGTQWEPGSEVSDKQVGEEFAKAAIERGELEALPEAAE